MKRKSIICMMLLSMMLGMFSTSCEDMLTPDSERHAYTVAKDTLYSYWGILKSLQNIAERYVILNECRGDLVDETSFISDTINAIVSFGNVSNPDLWKDGACTYLRISDYYHVINSCNAYIEMCDTTRTTGTNQSYMVKELAQVHAIRAWVYMQLLYAYGEDRVPFYKEAMLTTDGINKFIGNKAHPKVTAKLLAQELGPDLEVLEKYELNSKFGLPGYNSYTLVCHSSKCMFPIPIVLGDLYLLSGDYAKSAAHYFEYIKSDKCGSLLVDEYCSRANLDVTLDYPIYTYDETNIPFEETGAVSKGTELITCIPSNMGKLNGKVLTDVNRLFGFEAQMRASNGGIETSDGEEASYEINSISLNTNYERELIPSRGYEALCDSQKFEVYVGSSSTDFESLEVLPDVGDARRAWIYRRNGAQWTFRQGDDILYGKMVSKQNPGGYFTTVYPAVYRKSTVWLRYAEALNRAGFPSYAFAVLKNGLCNNEDWFPGYPKSTYEGLKDKSATEFGSRLGETKYDYPVNDSLLFYHDPLNNVDLPEGWNTTNQKHHLKDLVQWMNNYFDAEYEASQQTEEPMAEKRHIDEDNPSSDPNIYWAPASVDAFGNTPNVQAGKSCACYYLDRRELELAAKTDYMDYKQVPGQKSSQRIYWKEQGRLLTRNVNWVSYPTSTGSGQSKMYTIGVHQRGCGSIQFDDPEHFPNHESENARSSFNYVAMVQKKIEEETGRVVTEDDIYSGNIDEDVKNAVEDLIIDEMGLELAFEGSRFSDLYRVAKRRGNDYLAKRIAKRHTGKAEDGAEIRKWLNEDRSHWFLPVPED